MQPRLQIILILSSFLLFCLVLELIRKGRLREEYSLIWLFSATIVFILSVFKGSLRFLADLVQIGYAPSLIFMVGLGLVTTIQLLQTIVISKLTSQNRELIQRLAILEWGLRRLSQTNQATTKRTLAEYEETEIAGNRPRWGHLRSTETLGAAGDAPHPTETVKGGDGGRVAKHDPPHDGAGLDILHDRKESGQARSV